MRRFLGALVLGCLALAVGFAPAGGTKSSGNTLQYPVNGTEITWIVKGRKNLANWKIGKASVDASTPNQLQFAEAKGKGLELVNTKGGGADISTAEKYGDCTIDLEFMIPRGSNSGIYVMGEYEVQVFDSYGKKKLSQGDLGAIYSAAAPRTNASKKPGEWQKIVIDFQAPRFEGDKRTAKAKFLKVVLNGEVIHENVVVNGATPGGLTGKEAATGPLMFQGDHGPVVYRNIKITPRRGQ